MKRRVFLSILVCPFMGLLTSCNKDSTDSFCQMPIERAKLISPFESYASSSEVEGILKSRGHGWKVVENEATVAVEEKRPPFNVYVISVDDFTHLGFQGILKFEFFNDRLMATSFYPSDLVSYRKEAERTWPQLRTEQGNTSIGFGTDHEKRGYIAWEDVRLRDEFMLWIKRNA